MAETMKDTATTGRIDDMKSRFTEVTGRVSEVARDVADRVQENRPLMYAGIGVLVFAAGLGVWALIRQFGGTDEIEAGSERSY